MLIAATSLTEGGNIARSIGTINRRYIRSVYMKFKMRAKKAEAYITPVRKPPHRHTNMAISNHGNASSKRVCMGSSQTIVICTYSTLIFMYFVFCDYIIPRGLQFVKGKYTISTKKFEKMQTVCKEGRKKYRSGTFFNFMSLRGTAHKGAQTPPLYEFPA